MITNCPHCNKDLIDLKPTQRGNHISNCKLNPNFKEYQEKRVKTRTINQRKKNPILKLKLNCLSCGKEFEIEAIESYYKNGRYQKCCSKKCANHLSIKDYDDNEIKKDFCKDCGKEIQVKKRTKLGISNCDNCKNKLRKKYHKNKTIKNKKFDYKIENKKIYYRIKKIIVCKFCGDEECERPDVCKRFKQKNNVYVKYFGFDINKFGNKEIYDIFDKIVNELKNDYFVDELSFPDIAKKYKMNYQTVQTVFKSLKIIPRTLSISIYNAIKNGKFNYDNVNTYPYKSGHHITWNNKKVHYRSSYELDYYKKLDEQKIDYDVEKIRIEYFDTQKKKRRIAIPDVYIQKDNLIVEIKSTWTHDEQNWEDRLKVYKELGYNVKLIIGDSKNGTNSIMNYNDTKV